MKFRRWPIAIGVVALALGAVACNTISEASGTIDGVVYGVDDSGAEKPGPPAPVRISLFDADSGNIVHTTTSNADGTFHLSVPAGRYTVSAGGRAEPVRVDSGKSSDVRVAVPAQLKSNAEADSEP